MQILFWFLTTFAALLMLVAIAMLYSARDFLFDPGKAKRKGHVFLSFHAHDILFAEQVERRLNNLGIATYRYIPGSFTQSTVIQRPPEYYSERETYFDALRKDPKSTAIFYFRAFIHASCLILLNPGRQEKASAFVQAEIDIAKALGLTIYAMEASEQLEELLVPIESERIPWGHNAYSKSFMSTLRNHMEALYSSDETLWEQDAYKELLSLIDHRHHIFTDGLDDTGLQPIIGCGSIVLSVLALLCAAAALGIKLFWLPA